MPHPHRPSRLVTLPDLATPLVGRERELAHLQDILNWPDVSMLTLTGPGGVGKTRLAIEAARRLADRFPDGVVFVPLTPVRQADQLLPSIAKALDVQESQRPTLDTLQTFLRDRQMLLVLDNFEHVMAGAPDLAVVLRAAPDVTVIVTSRECLRLYGEHEYQVPPLSLSTDGVDGEAVRLFVERVRAVQPDFVLSAPVASDVAAICRQLDGLPLAIELAAARIRLFPPAALLARLDNRLSFLTSGARDLPSRQQTLRAAIDWSYDLLHATEQTLFERLSVFIGGFTFGAAEAVCGEEIPDVLSTFASLVEKSLVRRLDPGETRFGMLETLREYAAEKLAQHSELGMIRERCAKYYVAWSDQVQRDLEGPQQAELFRQVVVEQPNVLAVIRERLAAGDEQSVADLAWNLAWGWGVQVEYGAESLLWEGVRNGTLTQVSRGQAHYALTWLAFRRGDFLGAQRLAAESAELLATSGDLLKAAYARTLLGMCLMAAPEHHEESLSLSSAAVSTAEQFGTPWLAVFAYGVMAWIHVLGKNFGAAEWAARQAIGVGERLGEQNMQTWSLLALAGGHIQRGQATPETTSLLRRAYSYARATNDPSELAAALYGLAAVASLSGQDASAARLLGATDATRNAHNISSQLEPMLFGPLVEHVRARLGDEPFQRHHEEGQSMQPEEALASYRNEATTPQSSAVPAKDSAPAADGVSRLTASEREVLRLLAAGLSNKQIAARRGTGVYTVNDQVSAVLSKLGVPNRAAATRYAIEHRLD